MFGISYGGISQLFAAQLRPPALEAIAPLSVVDATATTLYPGGVLNTGFAVPLGRRAPVRRRTGRPAQRRALGLRTDPERRHDLRGQPGPARRGDATCWQKSKKTRPTTRPSPTRWTRSRSSTTSTSRRSWHASGRTSRPAGTAPIWRSTSPAPSTSGSRSPTAPISTRSIRTRSTGCTTSWSCTSRTRRRSTTAALVDAAAPTDLSGGVGAPQRRRNHAAAGPDPGKADVRDRRWRPSRRSPRSACCSTTARDLADRQHDARQPLSRVRTVLLRRSRSPARRPARGTSGPNGTLSEAAGGGRRGRLLHLRTRAPRR